MFQINNTQINLDVWKNGVVHQFYSGFLNPKMQELVTVVVANYKSSIKLLKYLHDNFVVIS